jgi:Flp pilus assembly protein TadD
MEQGESHFQEAEEELQRAKNLAPEDPFVSDQLQRLKMMRQAIASRDEGEMEAETPKEYYNLGKAYESDGDRGMAIKCFRNAIELGYEEPIVFSKLGQLLAIDDERREEAKELLEDAIDRGLRDTQTLRSLARTLQKLGHLSEAETYFTEALSKDERNDEDTDIKLLHWYGLFLLEKEDYEGAYSFLRQTFELDKSNPYFANDVGRVILEADWREKFSEARELFKRAIELSGEDFKWPRRYLSELEDME